MTTNPLRILDSKVESTQALLVGAPTLHDYLDEESIAHFEGLKARLDAVGLRYEINQKLVRGLDYYCRTAFEWVTDKLGAQGTVCGGGRYDGLVSQFGGKPTPGVGFAMGVERLVLLLETLDVIPAELNRPADLYVCAFGEPAGWPPWPWPNSCASFDSRHTPAGQRRRRQLQEPVQKGRQERRALRPDPRGGRGGQSRGRFQAPA